MPDTLTTQSPNEPPETRPVPPSWATVAPLLARWQMALLPGRDLGWTVLTGYPESLGLPRHDRHNIPFALLPAVIAVLAAQCAADTTQLGTDAGEGAR